MLLGSCITLASKHSLPACLWCRWDQQGGCNMPVMSLSERGGGGGVGGRQDRRVTFSMIENEGIGMSGQAEWVQVNVAATAALFQVLLLHGKAHSDTVAAADSMLWQLLTNPRHFAKCSLWASSAKT